MEIGRSLLVIGLLDLFPKTRSLADSSSEPILRCFLFFFDSTTDCSNTTLCESEDSLEKVPSKKVQAFLEPSATGLLVLGHLGSAVGHPRPGLGVPVLWDRIADVVATGLPVLEHLGSAIGRPTPGLRRRVFQVLQKLPRLARGRQTRPF